MSMKMFSFMIVAAASVLPQNSSPGFGPGQRVVLDAHNCYPYEGQWGDRIDRALRTGMPIAIEQDLGWYSDPATGRSWSVLAHETPYTGKEPTLASYFFNRIRPFVERALLEDNRRNWPLITLNLDFKSEEPEHLRFIWELLNRYQSWLTTAPRTSGRDQPMPLDRKPLLVLTGESDLQERVFHDDVPIGHPLLVFGA